MKISELLDGIRKKDMVLPEFQREYVWTRDQAKQLMVSLQKGYPVGSLLFWKTDEPPELKNIDKIPEKLGMVQIILDGQQRLTTLYLLLSGEIPPFYIEEDITTDPRDLYYNLENGEFQYYQSTKMEGNPVWRRVVDCFSSGEISVFEIARQLSDDDSKIVIFAEIYNDHMNRLRNMMSVDLPVQNVPSFADLKDAIDIFDRVNSQGTKLTDAELALTHIVGKWAHARREMKLKIEDLDKKHFSFDLTFMTRSLTSIVTKRALFETIHGVEKKRLIEGWKELGKILDYLVSTLPQRASIHSTEDLNTTNVLVPVVTYLALNEGRFPNDRSMMNAFHWLYAAHTWSRYTSQTDQRLELDVSLIVRGERLWDALREQIIDQRGRIEVKGNDLEGRGIRHPLYRMMYILAKAQSAVDWFNGAPLGTTHGKSYRIHNHHIFPQSILYDDRYDSENHLHQKIVNEIGNRAFLTAETNLDISNRLPEEYFPEVEERFQGALAKQFIPMNPHLWKLSQYPEFLEARRNLIALKLNEFMDSLLTKPEIVHEMSIAELIPLGESATLEFKSTLQWDVVQNSSNKGLRKQILKTVAAFLNSAGGTLVIGVEDDGNIYGIENDLKTLEGSKDRFANLVTTLISDYIGVEFALQIKLRFEEIDGIGVCVIDVGQAPIPAYIRGDRGSEFYTRFGPLSRMLDPEETVSYINTNWN